MAVWQLGRARKLMGRKNRPSSPISKRRSVLDFEPLEQRQLLSVAPTLSSVITNIPDDGDVLSLSSQSPTTLTQAPQELIFKFDNGQTIDPSTLGAGIKITNSAGAAVAIGYEGVPEQSNEAVVRFQNTLPNDTYTVSVTTAIKNSSGQALGSAVSTKFTLDYGAQVSAVVPQPITRTAQGTLSQALNQIQVYFSNSTLNPTSATNPQLYQLIYTGGATGTATTNDDVVYNPASVTYDAVKNMATLTFAQNLDQLGSGAGTYRLRIGDNATNGVTQTVTVTPDQAGDSFSTALQLGTLTTTTKLITGAAITAQGSTANNPAYPLTYPGGPTDPGAAEPARPYVGHELANGANPVDRFDRWTESLLRFKQRRHALQWCDDQPTGRVRRR